MSDIAILGAGLAGLSAAYHLKKDYVLFERGSEVGGVCRSFHCGGYTFDATGHVLHFRTPQVGDFVHELLGGEWIESERSAWVYTQEKCIPYPFQSYFNQLSDPVRQECLSGFLTAQKTQTTNPPATFEEWILSRFGSGIARHFLIPYNTKLWRVTPKELGIDGVQKYIPVPTLEEIITGVPRSLGYNARFYYPRLGGIQGVALALQEKLTGPVRLEYEAEKINFKKHRIDFVNGESFGYRQLLATIPLPELGRLLQPLPVQIQQLFDQLQWVSVCSFHFGVRNVKERQKHWIYFAEPEFPFYRVVLSSNYAPHLAPRGKGTLQIEVSLPAAERRLSLKDLRSSVIRGLIKTGLLNHENQIEVEQIHTVRHGYAVFTPGCQQVVRTITAFLEEQSINVVGRYASWEYMSLEDCVLAGQEVARQVNAY